MREAIIAGLLTIGLLWLASLVGRQFALGVAVGIAYVAALMLAAFRNQGGGP